MCTTLHVLWSLVYIGCGAVQLVVGIFFLFASDLPFLRLGSNVVAGGWVSIGCPSLGWEVSGCPVRKRRVKVTTQSLTIESLIYGIIFLFSKQGHFCDKIANA